LVFCFLEVFLRRYAIVSLLENFLVKKKERADKEKRQGREKGKER